MFTKQKTDVCKGISILMLIFHHLFYNKDRIDAHNITFKLFAREDIITLAGISRVCVWIFVFLSAYGMSWKYLQKPSSEKMNFIPEQWFSLMKLYWIFFLMRCVTYIISGGDIVHQYNGSLLFFFLDMMAWADFFHTPMIQAAFWYICFTQILVLTIPIIVCVSQKMGGYCIILLFLLLQFASEGIVSPYGGAYLNYIIAAVCGGVFAERNILNYLSKKELNFRQSIMIKAILVILVASTLAVSYDLRNNDPWRLRACLFAFAAVGICLLAGVYTKGKVMLGGLSFLGKYSGIMYLIHPTLYTQFPQIVFRSESAVIVYILLLIESLMIGIFFQYIRKRIAYDRWMDRIFQKVRYFVSG